MEGTFVDIVLSIIKGRGMSYIKTPVVISAMFNGRTLESEPAGPGEMLYFNSELVWTMDKKHLRTIRSDKQPLRLDCMKISPSVERERVGFILLSLRSADLIQENQKPTLAWHKFVGVFNKKNYDPEIYISLSIQDHVEERASCFKRVKIMSAPSSPDVQTKPQEAGDASAMAVNKSFEY